MLIINSRASNMATLTVFTTTEVLEAAKATTDCFTISKKKGDEKKYTGNAFFLDNRLKGLKHNGVLKQNEAPWITTGDVNIPLFAVRDPAEKTKGTEEYKPKIVFKASEGGDLGQLLLTLQPQYVSAVNGAMDSGIIPKKDGRLIHDLLKLKYSPEHPKTPNQLRDEPLVELSIDFGLFPDKYPHAFLRGKPKTTFLDGSKRLEVDGKVTYAPATVTRDDGTEVPVTQDNLHLFITPGSTLLRARLDMSSTSVSAYWISCKIHAQELIIKPGGGGGFDDAAPAAATTAAATTAASPPAVNTDAVNAPHTNNQEAPTPVDAATAANAIDEI